jgi:CrcB protein
MQILWVAGFGVVGVLARYGLDLAFKTAAGQWPISTFGINLLGSLLAGLAYGLAVEKELLPPEIQTGIFAGLLGGFTTFSAYALQGARLLGQNPALAFAYLGLSPILGVALAWLGILIARAF